jgi:hydroxymethylglutaryl-CoA lyase
MKVIECPRDAMQGITQFIDTDIKVNYLNLLLQAGFDTLDFGSFVSPKAIPQMRDTAEVLARLELGNTATKLLAIVANTRGAEQAVGYDEISYLGFPLSVSETFQQRNTNKSIEAALAELQEIQNLCEKHSKTLVTYLSMGFGNPYGDPYSPEVIEEFVQKLDPMGIKIISLSDTIGVSQPENIKPLFTKLIQQFPHIEFGAHLHSQPHTAHEKVEAALEAGCRRMDGALLGFGGCPMAKDDLTGNMATEIILATLQARGIEHGIRMDVFEQARQQAIKVFSVH